LNSCDIKNIESEAGIIASIVMKPELTFYSEQLKPNHFSDKQNAYIYYAVCELAKMGIEKIDAYNITNALNKNPTTRKATDTITITALNELIDVAKLIARNSVEEYALLVNNVLDAAFRRTTYDKLIECERLCFSSSETDIEQKIYSVLDDVMMEFSTTNDIPQFKDVVDDLWQEIEERQTNGMSGIPFKFPALNNYATLEAGELFIFAGEAKMGKSAMLLSCAVDLLRKDKAVLYVDSELNSRLFLCRLLSHLTGIKFSDIRAGRYTQEDKVRIDAARQWVKSRKFIHLYIPIFNEQAVYTAVKKASHMFGKLDVLVVDYFKSTSEQDAFGTYNEMGKFIDTVKNKICGDCGIAGLGAVQATSTGKVADSAKIGRNASTIALILNKTPEEIEADGVECGNKKLRILLNRNGAQMQGEEEYIDLRFDGSTLNYMEADRQHIPDTPF